MSMTRFSYIIPLSKGTTSDLIGTASTTSMDRDEERMSQKALNMMVEDIKTVGVNLFGNHEHNWENTLGVIKQAELVNNQVQIGITLDDAQTNPKVPMMMNKLKRGIKLGLSVGGTVTKDKWEYDKELGKKIRILDEVKIYEVSVVGIPSNADSFLSLNSAIGKSYKSNSLNISKSCPVCYTQYKEKCPLCLYQLKTI